MRVRRSALPPGERGQRMTTETAMTTMGSAVIRSACDEKGVVVAATNA